MMKKAVLFLSLLFSLSIANGQILQSVTVKEILPDVQTTAQAQFASDAVLTAAVFAGIDYQGISLTMDKTTGKATGWIYRWYSPQLDSVVLYIAVKIPIVGVQTIPLTLDTISQYIPVSPWISTIEEPWIDIPQALEVSKNGGAGAYLQKYPDARVILSVIMNNPSGASTYPQGNFWLIRYAAVADTLTCIVDAESATAYQCSSSNAPNITSAPIISARVGEQYTYVVQSGGVPPPTYSLVTAPSGMTIDSTTGQISWVPTADQDGQQPVTVRAENTEGYDEQSFNIIVLAAAVAPKITSNPVTEIIANSAYTYQLTSTGSPTPKYKLTTCPAGMTVDEGRGKITWTPAVSQAGNHDVSVTASNSAGNDVQDFQVTVMVMPKFRTFPSQFDAVVDSLFTYTFSADGYPAPTFTLLGHPDGMTMDSLGVLSWTPTASQVGPTTVTVETINRAGSQTLPFTITVSPVAGIDDPGTLPACILLPGYPNPVSTMRNTAYSLPMDITRPVSINGVISDAAGRRIRSFSLDVNTPGLRTIQIPIDGVLPGMYVVMLNMGNKQLVQSFVVVK